MLIVVEKSSSFIFNTELNIALPQTRQTTYKQGYVMRLSFQFRTLIWVNLQEVKPRFLLSQLQTPIN